MLRRPESFTEVYGQDTTVKYLKARIESNSLPQFIIFCGEEGLGKTTLAKICAVLLACPTHCGTCPTCQSNIESVIRKNVDTSNIKTFKMSHEGGKDAAMKLLEQCNTNFLQSGAKALIADEVQNMSKAAYDALLNDTEYLPTDTYLFMCTTDIGDIPKTLRSRATILNLQKINKQAMLELLKNYTQRNGIHIENEPVAFDIICSYSDYKARAALKVLEAMGENRQVKISEIKDYVSFQEPTDIIPLLETLSGSLLDGVSLCLNLEIDDKTQDRICDFLTECLKGHRGSSSVKYDHRDIRKVLGKVDESRLVKFLYEIANLNRVSSQSILSAYLRSHTDFSKMVSYNPEVLQAETRERVKAGVAQQIKRPTGVRSAPDIEDLLRNATVLKD
jgi:DNA polymerase III delta prime subunit